jgi:hypothetical protein
VVLGYFRVVRWFTKVLMLFFRFFLRKNSLKIKFLEKKKNNPSKFLTTTIVLNSGFQEVMHHLEKKTVVANNMSTIPYKIKKI